VERRDRGVQLLDGLGLAVFCVTGASKALAFGLGPVQAALLGAITGIGGGMLRDLLLNQTPTVLRQDLYAIPALLGAGVVAAAHELGSTSGVWTILGAALCFGLRWLGLRGALEVPTVPRV
jgi:uncharacterized membrane protein YeiH